MASSDHLFKNKWLPQTTFLLDMKISGFHRPLIGKFKDIYNKDKHIQTESNWQTVCVDFKDRK